MGGGGRLAGGGFDAHGDNPGPAAQRAAGAEPAGGALRLPRRPDRVFGQAFSLERLAIVERAPGQIDGVQPADGGRKENQDEGYAAAVNLESGGESFASSFHRVGQNR